EWVHVQLHQQKGMISLSPPTICNSALFAKAESTLTSSRRHLGDELYDQFRITLDDMKPEYVG
ncbi:hypothetical protein CI677_02140, partial [Klebsiella pneumoniae]